MSFSNHTKVDFLFTLIFLSKEVLRTYPLYVTFDKDVMHRADNMQNWNSGKMTREEVLYQSTLPFPFQALIILRILLEFSGGNLLALDVVGDFTPVKVQGLYRHW